MRPKPFKAQRLKELLASGEVRVIESGKIDRYARTLAHLTVGGRNVGGVLIGEGLAPPYNGGRRQGWCGNSEPCRLQISIRARRYS